MIILQNSFFSYGNICGIGHIFININYDDTRKRLATLMDFINTFPRTHNSLATYNILATRLEAVTIPHTLLMVLLTHYQHPHAKKVHIN